MIYLFFIYFYNLFLFKGKTFKKTLFICYHPLLNTHAALLSIVLYMAVALFG